MDDRGNREVLTTADRLIAAAIGAIALEVTAVLAIGATLYGARYFSFSYAVAALWWGIALWGFCAFVAGGLMGYALGPNRLGVWLGHLWGTEKPARPFATLGLWACLVAFIGGCYLVALHAL